MRLTRSKLTAVLACVAVCSLVLAGLELAAAHNFNAETKVTLDSGGPSGAKGRVISPRSSCERNRLVTLLKIEDGPDTNIGTDRTNDAGKWQVDAPLSAGDYQAKVKPREKKKPGHRHRCAGDRSKRKHL